MDDDTADRLERAQRTGDADLLDAVVNQLIGTVGTGDDAAHVSEVSLLAIALHTRFSWTGRRGDIDDAATVASRALRACPAGQPDHVALSANLANVLRIRYEATGARQDLDEAVELGRAGDTASTADAARHTVILNNLGLCLRIRFQAAGARPDIDEAVTTCLRAIDAAPPGFAAMDAVLANAAGAYQARFERVGDPADLDQAIDVTRRAAQASGRDPSHRMSILSNLCAALQTRAEHTGSGGDVDEAIAVGHRAVDGTPPGHIGAAGRCANLSTAYVTRFDRTKQIADIDAAIAFADRALAATPEGDPALPGRLTNLAAALRTRAQHSDNVDDLVRATVAARRAVDAVPVGHPGRAGYLSNLGACLRAVFRRTNDRGDADAAADVLRRAAAESVDDGNRAVAWSNLGGALYDTYTVMPDPALAVEAVAAFRAAAAIETARPRVRVAAAAAWGRIAADQGDWRDALDGLARAVDLLTRVAPRQLDDEDQQHELGRHAAIASDAAACALQLGRIDDALMLLEQGRGILLSQAIDARGDLTDLTAAAPELADRFDRVRRRLDRPVADPGTGGLDRDQRRAAAVTLDATVEEIRRIPGFADFLRPPRIEELCTLAEAGPLVVVNVSELRSDAMIVLPDGVRSVLLPMVTAQAVRANAALLDGGPDAVTPDDDDLAVVLDWVWRAIVEPIAPPPLIDPGRTPPRWWWMPTGLLSLLPLHAARPAGGLDGLLQRAVCSYTPTLRALRHARSSAPVAPQRILALAAASNAAGALPAVDREMAMLDGVLLEPADIVTDGELTRPVLLEALAAHPWVHVACHATGDAVASRSALSFADAEGVPLRVADIARWRLDSATLAYLSACSTARTGADIPDEVLHIASAFQLAGYRNVIGTLWPVRDAVAARVARAFYRSVRTSEPSAANAAFAVHSAATEMFHRMPDHPTAWAAHVHVGA